MYGNDISGPALAATGVVAATMHSVMLAVVIILAGLALVTTAKVLHHRATRR